MSERRLTQIFFNKLKLLIENCQGLYWNEQGTGFIIVDFSKLEQKLIQTWGHHLRTFLKKLLAYGFQRRVLFDGAEYTHSDFSKRDKQANSLHIKQEDISIEEKEHIELIQSNVIRFTQFLQQTNESEEKNKQRAQMRNNHSQKTINKMMFKTLNEGKSIDKQQLRKDILRLKNNIIANKAELESSKNKLHDILEEENQLVSLIKQPQQKHQQGREASYERASPVKIESQQSNM